MTEAELSALLTDGEQMKGVLQARVPGYAGGGVIDGCEIVHTRYRTTERDRRHARPFLSVGYRLEVLDAIGGRAGQLVHAQAYGVGDSAERFRRATATGRFAPRFGPAVAHLPELGTLVWAFPNDPRLPHLPEVIDPIAVRRHLPPELGHVADVDVQVVRYKPEVRCITRYRLAPSGLVIFGKTFRHDGAAEVWRRMDALATRLAGDADAFLVPRPLGFDASVKTVWQTGVSGTPLIELVRGGDGVGHVTAAGRGLARLHALELDGLPHTTLGDRFVAARAEAAELGAAYPCLRGRLEALVARLEHDVWSLPPMPDGLVHGDFLLKQLVVDGDRLAIFDFDNLALGDPLQDLAKCIADLYHQELAPGTARALTASLLSTYRAHAHRQVPGERLRWQLSVQLLRDAYYWHKRRQLTPGFERELEGLLARAEHPPVGE